MYPSNSNPPAVGVYLSPPRPLLHTRQPAGILRAACRSLVTLDDSRHWCTHWVRFKPASRDRQCNRWVSSGHKFMWALEYWKTRGKVTGRKLQEKPAEMRQYVWTLCCSLWSCRMFNCNRYTGCIEGKMSKLYEISDSFLDLMCVQPRTQLQLQRN